MNASPTPGCLPFCLAALAYLIFGLFSRAQVGQLAWVLIALVAIPALAGISVQQGTPTERQRTAFWAVLWAAVFYVSLNLIRIRGKISSGDTGGTLLASTLACLVYGALAGIVAALVVRLRIPVRRTQGEKR